VAKSIGLTRLAENQEQQFRARANFQLGVWDFLNVSRQRADYIFGCNEVKGNNICHGAQF
jgi:hypothetical protein